MSKALFILAFLFTQLQSFALTPDLKPVHLELRFSPTQQYVRANDVIQFNITLKCLSGEQERSVLMPNSKDSGQLMIYLSFYTVDNHNHYTRVFAEERPYTMSVNQVSPVWFHNLAKGDSLVVPVFYGDAKNYDHQIEAHHSWPKLKPGKYKVLAHYNPWDEEQAEMVYNKVSYMKDNDDEFLAHRFNMPEDGLISNYINLTVRDNGTLEFEALKSSETCESNCRLCTSVSKGNWREVKKLINDASHDPWENQGSNFPHDFHTQVAYLYPGPDAILASLPSYYGRKVIFKNDAGYHYYNIGWQVGKIYPARSRLNYLLQNIGLRYFGKTEDLDYFEIISFEEI